MIQMKNKQNQKIVFVNILFDRTSLLFQSLCDQMKDNQERKKYKPFDILRIFHNRSQKLDFYVFFNVNFAWKTDQYFSRVKRISRYKLQEHWCRLRQVDLYGMMRMTLHQRSLIYPTNQYGNHFWLVFSLLWSLEQSLLGQSLHYGF